MNQKEKQDIFQEPLHARPKTSAKGPRTAPPPHPAKISGACDYCGYPAVTRRIYDCIAVLLCEPCRWAMTVPKYIQQKAHEENKVKSYQTDKNEKKKTEFPPDVHLEIGVPIIFQMLDVRTGIRTKYGPGTATEVILKGDDKTKHTLWWPKKLPMPPMLTPCILTKRKDGEYTDFDLGVAETKEEADTLWYGVAQSVTSITS